MSQISEVTISTTESGYVADAADTAKNNTSMDTRVLLSWIGVDNVEAPTQLFIAVSLAPGISPGTPTVDSRQSNMVDLTVNGTVGTGGWTAQYLTMAMNGTDEDFDVGVILNGGITTYTFKKKRVTF